MECIDGKDKEKAVWKYESMGVYRQPIHDLSRLSTVRAGEYIYEAAEKTPISDCPLYIQKSGALQFLFYSIQVAKKVYSPVLLFPQGFSPFKIGGMINHYF